MLKLSWVCVVVPLMIGPAIAQDASSSAMAPSTMAPSATAPSASMPSAAEPAPVAADWQDVIAAQIQAFRDHDATKALSFAGDAFHKRFTDPQEFFDAIMQSGYTPIMQSTTQSFGDYQLLDSDHVLQEVKLTGTDQTVYEAIYQMAKEEGSWRVYGVQLAKTKALGV